MKALWTSVLQGNMNPAYYQDLYYYLIKGNLIIIFYISTKLCALHFGFEKWYLEMTLHWIILGTCDQPASLCECWRHGRALWYDRHHPLCTYVEGRRGRSHLHEWGGCSQVLWFVYFFFKSFLDVQIINFLLKYSLMNYYSFRLIKLLF